MKTAMVLEADWREAYWQLLVEGMLALLAVGPPLVFSRFPKT